MRNKTIRLSSSDWKKYQKNILLEYNQRLNTTICGDSIDVLKQFPSNYVDLIFADPPYNKSKKYAGNTFLKMTNNQYHSWLTGWLFECDRVLNKSGSIYVCSDWEKSSMVQSVLEKFFIVKNRITWKREKGRGSKSNWKNCHEDIWFAKKSNEYTFNVNDVKLARKVKAPYRDKNGKAKDWDEETGLRFTHPSNLWDDLVVPFWSMSENTEHPTQKSEKLLAKVILASSNKNDIVLDPFLGSGTSSVVAKKLGRKYIGIEKEMEYCVLSEKRLAESNLRIQGYEKGHFEYG